MYIIHCDTLCVFWLPTARHFFCVLLISSVRSAHAILSLASARWDHPPISSSAHHEEQTDTKPIYWFINTS